MAAKVPAKKAVPKKAVVKASKTKVKIRYTSAQRKAYTAASKAAIKSARISAKAARVAAANAKAAKAAQARFVRNALGVQGRRNVAAARSKAAIGRSGKRLQPASGKQAVIRLKYQTAQAAAYQRRTQTYTYQQAAFLTGLATIAANKKAVARLVASQKRLKAAKAKAVAKKVTAPKVKGAPRKPGLYAAVGAKAGAAAASRIKVPKAPAKKPVSKTRKAASNRMDHLELPDTSWITYGNDKGVENCVGVAVANHLLLQTGVRATEDEVRMLYWRDSVSKAITLIDYQNPWKGIGLSEYGQVKPEDAKPGDIVGFETTKGSHCAVLMPDNMVISWGEIIPLESEIDEAWEVEWTTSR